MASKVCSAMDSNFGLVVDGVQGKKKNLPGAPFASKSVHAKAVSGTCYHDDPCLHPLPNQSILPRTASFDSKQGRALGTSQSRRFLLTSRSLWTNRCQPEAVCPRRSSVEPCLCLFLFLVNMYARRRGRSINQSISTSELLFGEQTRESTTKKIQVDSPLHRMNYGTVVFTATTVFWFTLTGMQLHLYSLL